jgi:hypothetical protein
MPCSFTSGEKLLYLPAQEASSFSQLIGFIFLLPFPVLAIH